MKTNYRRDLKAHLSVDGKKVVHIRHSQEYWAAEQNNPRLASGDYLKAMAETLRIPAEQFGSLDKRVSFYDPREQDIEYQLNEEKHLFDSTTVGYYQTYLNVPVWRRGLTVKVKQSPTRVLAVTNNSEDGIRGRLPSADSIKRYKAFFREVARGKAVMTAGLGEDDDRRDDAAPFVRNVLKDVLAADTSKPTKGRPPKGSDIKVRSGKFFVYKYDPQKRYGGKRSPASGKDASRLVEETSEIPMPKLPPVPDRIKRGESYLVAEIVFTSNLGGFNGYTWLILVELETESILYIECMTAGVNGLVFRRDPIVKTGDLGISSGDSIADLNMHQDDVLLNNLDAAEMGTQNLRGTFVDIEELTIAHADPDIDPPTEPSATNFEYDTRTNEFGAVNAYYHQTELFRTIESLGFPIATYLDGTTFPIPVDHRGLGSVINAHCDGDTEGTTHMCYALCDTTNLAEPLCRAVDPWVHWHEMGGHGLLYDHVGTANLGFSHSAGDGLAALQMDPESQLRAMNLPERFRYAPFRPFTAERRFDRDVGTWAWGSAVVGIPCDAAFISGDDGCYGSEQILATCHFRIYRSIGGDHSNLGRRQFASRMMTYLILRTIGNLTSGTNPNDAQLWCEEMQDVDLENWTSESLSGGAYNKVIRWSFEQQGSYQPAGAPTPVTTPGDPPEVDVYIDDGRAGEYQFQAVHWHNMSMWNRNEPDAIFDHQNAFEDVPNFMYGKVKNRGTETATDVTVKCYHSLPGAGLTWPDDFTEMSPIGGIPIPSIGPDSSEEITVGPFEWIPNVNVHGHDCVLMIASCDGDPSNVDNFTGVETVAEWRLVPNDNNVGQRNVTLVPGGEGGESLMAALDGAVFFAGNSFNRTATMEIRAELPRFLVAKGWGLDLGEGGRKFRLKPGQKRKIELKLSQGAKFTPEDVKHSEDRAINVYLYGNGILLGGMTYAIDPNMRKPSGGRRDKGYTRQTVAEKLLDSLNLSSEQKVKNVRLKNVSLDIDFE
ncbi:MAG TPA: hypothetical protein VJU86_07590 [Pyrinomonadaceae bacterium]|nr:hypothetical protein [Pyrinomonadaceae bacterium]